MKFFVVLVLGILLSACSVQQHSSSTSSSGLKESADPSRYQHSNDFAPLKRLDPDLIEDATPRLDPIRAAGNKSPYMVFGKVYHVMESNKNYKEQGKASWYGLKFHGHNTSNGEVYDIQGMTAAHKTLPLPSYVKVTNVANGRTAIVRVNDRGPFHGERIIDLSYAAATKLGYIDQGTAEVLVEAIDVEQWLAQAEQNGNYVVKREAVANTQAQTWLQVGAYSSEVSAVNVRKQLLEQFSWATAIATGVDGVHRVRMGPIPEQKVTEVSQQLVEKGFSLPLKIKP